jgi:ribosome-associated protein
MNRDDQYDEYDDDGRKSKSQRKREMHELQALGEALCALTPEKIRSLDLAPALAEAALFSKTLTSHEARRRHMQYMGRLVREHAATPTREVAALRRALDDLDHRKSAGTPPSIRPRLGATSSWRATSIWSRRSPPGIRTWTASMC